MPQAMTRRATIGTNLLLKICPEGIFFFLRRCPILPVLPARGFSFSQDECGSNSSCKRRVGELPLSAGKLSFLVCRFKSATPQKHAEGPQAETDLLFLRAAAAFPFLMPTMTAAADAILQRLRPPEVPFYQAT
jgi:hypothetical protein